MERGAQARREVVSEPTGQTPGRPDTSVSGQVREGLRVRPLRGPVRQRAVSISLEGEQSPWKYRV
jgi:hypothetical protein